MELELNAFDIGSLSRKSQELLDFTLGEGGGHLPEIAEFLEWDVDTSPVDNLLSVFAAVADGDYSKAIYVTHGYGPAYTVYESLGLREIQPFLDAVARFGDVEDFDAVDTDVLNDVDMGLAVIYEGALLEARHWTGAAEEILTSMASDSAAYDELAIWLKDSDAREQFANLCKYYFHN